MDTQSQPNQEANIKTETTSPNKTNENGETGGNYGGGRGRGNFRGRVYRGGRGGTLDGLMPTGNRGHNGDENSQHNDRGPSGERGGFRGRGRGRGRGGIITEGKFAPQVSNRDGLGQKYLNSVRPNLPPELKLTNRSLIWVEISNRPSKGLYKQY